MKKASVDRIALYTDLSVNKDFISFYISSIKHIRCGIWVEAIVVQVNTLKLSIDRDDQTLAKKKGLPLTKITQSQIAL